MNDENLDVTPDHVMVLHNAGPVGGPGMPEWGMLPIPKKLLKQGVRDMVRISDARMSGTSYGACILHVAPESYIGGPLAAVRNGDIITLDVAARTIRLEISDAEIADRLAAYVPQRGPRRAATSSCTPPMSRRPTRAATSTSSKGPSRSRSRRSTEAGGRFRPLVPFCLHSPPPHPFLSPSSRAPTRDQGSLPPS